MIRPWIKRAETVVREGYRKIVRREFTRPDGRELVFEIHETRDVVSLVAVTGRGTILIARQFRPGPERIVDELPGGGVDAGETPEAAARRELLEETGYEAGALRFLAANPVSAYATNRRHVFLATDCRKVAEPRSDGVEDIEVVELAPAAFRAHLRTGNLTDLGAGFLGLDALEAHGR